MRTVVQRVRHASVTIDERCVASIGQGMLLLVGFEDADTANDLEWMAQKVANLRIFDDADGVMNRSVKDVDGELLVVSQFTLYASVKKGNRPSYIRAAKPDVAIPLYESFCETMSLQAGREVKTGVFGADMKVSLLNDGPVTIVIDTKHKE
ncbi:D-tyrosyl-tRNA(Tyr) deacylase [Tannerella sp. oral taxon 808]|nr:D-tyrosyl-tRNA(Tyr) deacylase [Tannerella sp. oral taxon 808]